MAILKDFWGPFFGLALMLLTFAVQSVQPVEVPLELSKAEEEKLFWMQAAAISGMSFKNEKKAQASKKAEPFQYPNPAKAVWYAANDLFSAFSLRKGEDMVAEVKEMKEAPPQGIPPFAKLIWELKDTLNGTGADKAPLPKPPELPSVAGVHDSEPEPDSMIMYIDTDERKPYNVLTA